MIYDLRFTIGRRLCGRAQSLSLVTLLTASAFSLQPSAVWAQGSLTPPGAPAPTMITLAQIEPRTPITNTTAVTISAPGSYYLTANIAVTSGNAITIATNNVTLDLNGFTLSSTEASPTGTGILLTGARSRITIRNGIIQGNVTYNGSTFAGGGFAYGIYYSGLPRNVRVTDVSVSGFLDGGLVLRANSATVVDRCSVDTVGGDGIAADSVANSVAYICGSYGIIASSAHNSYGYATGNSDGLYVSTAENCYGISNTGTGVYAIYSALNCFGNSSSGDGLDAVTAQDSYGISSGRNGLNVTVASSCYGSGGDGYTGLIAYTAHNCYGNSDTGIGLDATIAANCYGASGSGEGLVAFNAGVMCCGLRTTPGGYNCVINETLGTIQLP